MYKKILFASLAVLFLPTVFVHAESTDTPKGAHPWNVAQNKTIATETSHWSLILNAGFNSFDGDYRSEMKHPVYAPAVGLGVEYTFTPFLGLGVDYKFDMYRVTGDVDASANNADILLKGYMHKAGAYLTIDLLSGFAPKLTTKLASINLLAGGGCGVYRNTTYYLADAKGNTANSEALSMDKYSALPYVNIGVDVEFNLSRSIALGIRGEYAYYTKDDVDGRYPVMNNGKLINGASTNNDGIVDVTLSLRYKIDAVHKTHVRNIPTKDIINQQIAKNDLAARGRDTVIIIYRDTVIYRDKEINTVVETARPEEYSYVYFEHGKSTLDDDAIIAIQQVAARMDRDTTLYAFIYGYCDNTGSLGVNTVLGDARSARVATELTEEYGVPADHIASCGRGIIVPKSGKKVAYAANRRAEIRLVTKEEFDRLIEECSEKQQVRYSQTAVVERTDDTPDWAIATETVSDETTLAKLARKYYDNTHCWVYIYQSNRNVITSPNNLLSGAKIYIPQLTEEQRSITKDECLKLLRAK